MSGSPNDQSWEECLLKACRLGELDTVQTLLNQQQKSSEVDRPPYTEMMKAAAQNDCSEIIEYCLRKGAELTCCCVMSEVAVQNAWKSLRVLVNTGGLDINYGLEVFGDFLLTAVRHDNFEMVRFCLEHGADPNLHVFQDCKISIASAAEDSSLEVACELIKYGARVKDSGAIVLAAENGKIDVVNLLLEHGADIDEIGLKDLDPRMDEDMGTPLHKAIMNRHIDLVRFLLMKGADARKPDFLGRRPLQWARMLGHADEAAVLEDHLRVIDDDDDDGGGGAIKKSGG